jgi:hypothetical protein
VHDAALLQIILKELVGTKGVRVLKDALTPGARTTYSVTKLLSYLQAMMDGEETPTLRIPNWCTARIPTATHPKKNASHVDMIARNPNIPSHAADAETRKRTRTMSQRRIPGPTARSSIARRLIESNRTSACGRRNTRATASNQSVTSLKWHSIHTTNSLQI